MGYSAFSVYHFLYIQEHPATEFQMSIIKKLPTRALSTMWGWTNNVELPKWLRVQIFLLWTRVYGCDLDEMRDPLDSYKNLAEFFARRLKPGVRPIQSGMVSPADGKVLIVGEVSGEMVEQVKGIKYELGEFLGMAYQSIMALQPPSKPLKLYHAVIYLAPGDYHGIHAPVDVTFKTRRHFPGYLLPVAPVICKLVPGLFALNERVVLIGEWRHGFFSLTPVGATNVGSIEIALEKHYQTNRRIHEIGRGDSGQKYYEKRYVDRNGVAGISVPKGEELAFFKLGSTVVLIFAAPEFEWEIQPGQKLRMGQRIGRVPGEEPPPNY
jgi:phosphatidylserine decarboxylase